MTAITKVTVGERLMWIGNTLFHQSLAVVSIFILWITFFYLEPKELFTWHVALSTLAYIPLMAEAIVLFASDNVWSQSIDRTTKYWIHGVILFISAVLVSIGIGFINYEKTAGHFQSIHAWTGLVSWIFVLASQVLGLAAAKAQSFSSIVGPVYTKFLHNLFGLLGYVFGMVSLAYGLYTGGFKRLTTDEARISTVYVLGIVTFWSILAALKSCYSQLKGIVSSRK